MATVNSIQDIDVTLRGTPGTSPNETVEVLGYYAPGDGGGGTFYWDPGGDLDNNGTIIVPGGGTGPCWRRVYDGAINVLWFGATGGDNADDTIPIRKAVTAAENGNLYFPKGNYNINDDIVVKPSTNILGVGVGSTIIQNSLNKNIFIIGDSNQPSNNCTIQNIKFVCSTGAATTEVAGITIVYSDYCVIEHCTFVDMAGHGIRLAYSNYNAIRDCEFLSSNATRPNSADIQVAENSSYNIIEHNKLYGESWHGVWLYSAESDYAIGNKIVNNHITNARAYGIAVYSDDHVYNSKTLISDNIIKGITGEFPDFDGGNGIYVAQAGGVIIESNLVEDCCTMTINTGTLAPAGIGVTNIHNECEPEIVYSAQVIIANNEVRSFVQCPCIKVNSSPLGVVIEGNVCNANTGVDGHAILIFNASNVTIDGNTIRQENGDFAGINIKVAGDDPGNPETAEKISVIGNIVNSLGISSEDPVNGSPGISFNSQSFGEFRELSVVGNIVKSRGTGLFIQSATNSSITGGVYESDNHPIVLMSSPHTRITGGTYISINSGVLFDTGNTFTTFDKSNYFSGSMYNDAASGVFVELYSNAVPSSGLWRIGDRVINSIPVIGQPKSWVCSTSGTPGTWTSEGNL